MLNPLGNKWQRVITRGHILYPSQHDRQISLPSLLWHLPVSLPPRRNAKISTIGKIIRFGTFQILTPLRKRSSNFNWSMILLHFGQLPQRFRVDPWKSNRAKQLPQLYQGHGVSWSATGGKTQKQLGLLQQCDFQLLPTGRRYRSNAPKTTAFKNRFIQVASNILNTECVGLSMFVFRSWNPYQLYCQQIPPACLGGY